MIVDSCCQTDNFRYDVTIYTGSRPGSGTSSSVHMILGETKAENGPCSLSVRPDVVFQRGSIDTFLITSDVVGPLLESNIF